MFIDGILQLPHAHVAPKPDAHQHAPASPDFSREAAEAVEYEGLPPLEPKRRAEIVIFTNVSSFWTKDAAGALADLFALDSTARSAGAPSTVVVSQGRVICADRTATCATYLASADAEVLDLQGGAIQPGLVSYGSSLGLAEIAMEPSTADGPVVDPLDPAQPPLLGNAGYIGRAADGLQFGTRNAL